MIQEKLKAWAKKHKTGTISVAIFLVLVILEHLLLFGSYYRHFGSVVGSGGDTFYNLSLFMQNLLNWKQGHFLSLQGDHISFYQNIIGVTSHDISPSVVFALLLPIFKNPIFIYNLIFFGNIFLLQLGIFFLVRFYTKNYYIAGFAGLLGILSPAVVGIYFVGHIHASLYWTLPFLILLLEKSLLLKGAKKIQWKYALGIFACALWLFFADWHVAIFSSIWIGFWVLFNIGIFRHPRKNFKTLVTLFAPLLVAALILVPLAKAYFGTSKIFNAERSADVVVNTNMNLEDYLGFNHVIPTAIDIVKPFFKNHPYAQERLDHYHTVARQAVGGFPDPLFRLTFWAGLLLFIPALAVFIWSRGKTFKKELLLLCVVFFASLIMVGPAIKMGGLLALESVPLPYYFLYSWLTPLHAIRALWRASTVGSLAVTVLWAMIAAGVWKKVKTSKVLPFEKATRSAKVTKVILFVCLGIFALGILIYQNNGFRGGYIQAPKKDAFFFSSMEKHLKSSEPISYAIVSDNMEDGNYNLQTSWFNLEQGRRALELAVGGEGGFLPLDWLTTINMTRQHQSLDKVIEMYAAKNIDVLMVSQDYLAEDRATRSILLSRGYKLAESNQSWQLWELSSEAPRTDKPDLQYSLTFSQFQEFGKEWHGILNIENPTNVPYGNPEKVHAINYELSFSDMDYVVKFSAGEVAMMYPRTGTSFPITLKPNVSVGSYNYVLKREGTSVTTGYFVQVLSKENYEQKVANAKNAPLELSSEVVNSPFIMDLYQVPVKLHFSVTSGGIINQPKERIVRNNQPVVAEFYDSSSAKVPLQHSFAQPDCNFGGNALPGDNLEFWCYQYVPTPHFSGRVELEK